MISTYAMESLNDYSFPGNVRELENIIERSVALETSSIVLPESLTLATFKVKKNVEELLEKVEIPPEGVNLDEVINEIEKNLVLKALEKTNGVTSKAAQILNISLRSMRYRVKKHQITVVDDYSQSM